MSEKVRFDTGEWKGEMRIVQTAQGYEVKAAVFLRPLILSPFFTVKSFAGEDAAFMSRLYAKRIKEAFES